MSRPRSQLEQYHEAGWTAPIDVMIESKAGSLAGDLERAELDHPQRCSAYARAIRAAANNALAGVLFDGATRRRAPGTAAVRTNNRPPNEAFPTMSSPAGFSAVRS
ncbi:MAG: hypothetical protein ACR2QK_20345 [Acidimicrobiales bacterium]